MLALRYPGDRKWIAVSISVIGEDIDRDSRRMCGCSISHGRWSCIREIHRYRALCFTAECISGDVGKGGTTRACEGAIRRKRYGTVSVRDSSAVIGCSYGTNGERISIGIAV